MCLNPTQFVRPATNGCRAGTGEKPMKLDPAITPGLMLEMEGFVILEAIRPVHKLIMSDRPLVADIRQDGVRIVATLSRIDMATGLMPVRSYVLESDVQAMTSKWKNFPQPLIRTVTEGKLTITIAIQPTAIPFIKLDC